MKSVKEVSIESKILKRLQNSPKCLELVHYLFKDAELQEMQERVVLLAVATGDEAEAQQSLDELCRGRTTIVVAHRLSTIKQANSIAVISDGKITEQGTHEELMALDGTYKHLYSLQFRESDK